VDAAVVFVTFIWGATFIVVKQALEDSSTLVFLALRFSLATVVMSLLCAGRLSGFAAPRRSLAGGFFAGISLFAGYFFQTVGLRYTTASKSAFITSLSVVMAPLIVAVVYRIVPRPAEGAGIILAITGLALMTLEGQGLRIGWGDLMTVICAAGFAAHIVIVGHFSPTCSVPLLSLAQIGTAALMAAGSFWWLETPWIRWSPTLAAAIAVTGVLATALAFTVSAWAQKHISPTRMALLLALEPVFAWLTAFVVARETLSPRGAAGGGLILAGVLLSELKPWNAAKRCQR